VGEKVSFQLEGRVKHYVIKDVIARGGMGVVWRAWDLSRNCFVAIKAVASDLVADPEFKIRFLDEVGRHARLNHPHIVPVVDVFEADEQSCFVMQLIEGASLANLLDGRENHRLEIEEAIPIIQDVLSALDYAHQRGIIHRDVKPSNILLDKHNRAHLIDFGIALAVGEKRRTRTGQIVGTSLYMSPEQIVRPKSIDHRSDVYSVGCVFYEMLTGRPPFLPERGAVGDTDYAIKQSHVRESPVPPKQRVTTIPAAIDKLIMWALEKDPEKRLSGCQEFSRLLIQTLAEEGDVSSWSKIFQKLWLYLILIYLLFLFLIYGFIRFFWP
jgi:serine/threonine-protein kinase